MKVKTKQITPEQYASYKGCSVQYIHRLLKSRDMGKMPEIIEVKRYSRFYVLVVDSTLGN